MPQYYLIAEGGHSFHSNTVGHQIIIPEGGVISTNHNVIPPMEHTGIVRLQGVGGIVQDHTIRVPGSLYAMLQKYHDATREEPAENETHVAGIISPV